MRPEIRSVIHAAHPPSATAFAAAGIPLDRLQLPEMLVLLGTVGCRCRTPRRGSEALADNLAELLPGHDAFLLENHGALTLGRSVRQAALRMDLLEQNARISLLVRQLGKPFALAAPDRGGPDGIPGSGWPCGVATRSWTPSIRFAAREDFLYAGGGRVRRISVGVAVLGPSSWCGEETRAGRSPLPRSRSTIPPRVPCSRPISPLRPFSGAIPPRAAKFWRIEVKFEGPARAIQAKSSGRPDEDRRTRPALREGRRGDAAADPAGSRVDLET